MKQPNYFFVLFFFLDMVCNNHHCSFHGTEHTTWGYYSKTSNECTSCKQSCVQDSNCAAVECGSSAGHCLWWAKNQCDVEKADVIDEGGWTCRKPLRKHTTITRTLQL